MKLRAKRESIDFDYEFKDGTVVKFKYLEPTSEMIDRSIELDESGVKERMDYVKEVFRECVQGDSELVEKMIDELMNDGNIYEAKAQLDEELGKRKAKGSKG